jgi:hypothetical protein
LKLLGVIIALIAVGEIPVVHAFSEWIDGNRSWLLPVTLGMTGAGLLIMIWGWVVVGIQYGQPMTGEETGRFTGMKGWARGRKVEPAIEWTFKEMKAAWRSGAWWRDPDMRRKYFITAGGTMLVLSGFSVFVVIADAPSVKLLMAGTVLYAIVRLTAGFRRA